MNSIREPLESSLRSLETSGGEAKRLQAIAETANPLKRLGLRAAHEIAVRRPHIVATALSTYYKPPDVKIMNGGKNSNVYRINPAEILKIKRASIGRSLKEQVRMADQMRYEHDALRAYVGPAILPHSIDVGPHPWLDDVRAVRIQQAFRPVDFVKLGVDEDDVPRLAARLRAIRPAFLQPDEDLEALIEGSRQLHDDTGLTIDLYGIDNEGFDLETGRLVVVDAQPVTSEHPDIQATIMHQLDNLERAHTASLY